LIFAKVLSISLAEKWLVYCTLLHGTFEGPCHAMLCHSLAIIKISLQIQPKIHLTWARGQSSSFPFTLRLISYLLLFEIGTFVMLSSSDLSLLHSECKNASTFARPFLSFFASMHAMLLDIWPSINMIIGI
jgi:hypothetical protein